MSKTGSILRRLIKRATRCPDCGESTCTLVNQCFGGVNYCPHCGQPCRSYPLIYIVAVCVGTATFILGAQGALGHFFSLDGSRRRPLAGPTLAWMIGYFATSGILAWLFPLRKDPRKVRTMWAKPRIKKKMTYPGQQVFRAICEEYERRYRYGIEWKDAENMTVCIRKEKRYFVEKYEEKVEYCTISVVDTEHGVSELCIELTQPENSDYFNQQVLALNEISRRVEQRLK